MRKGMHWLLLGGFLLSTPLLAQEKEKPNRQVANERIESAKIGFITNRLSLTTEQAPKFWPVYNEYNDKKQEIRQSLRKIRRENATLTASDNELMADMKEMINLRQKEVDLEKDYLNKFLKVITPRQVAELYHSEQDFQKELVKTLRQRREGHRPGN